MSRRWLRLLRAYIVLGDKEQARAAAGNARCAVECPNDTGTPADLSYDPLQWIVGSKSSANECLGRRNRSASLARSARQDRLGAGLKDPIVTASPGILPSLATLVTPGTAQLVCLSIQHGVQRLFHSPANHLAKMIPYSGFIDLDDLPIVFSSLIGCSFILS